MRALLVDDERLARVELRRLLEPHADVEIIGEASGAEEALEAIERLAPDLLFLDIQMPERSGFDLLEDLDRVPEVIFTTAFDEYAVRAFEVNALDYLLKPVEPERLASALDKLRRQGGDSDGAKRSTGVLGADDRVFVKDGEKCWILALGEVDLFVSEGNYTKLVFRGENPLIRRSLNELSERLDAKIFFRANRREIVNLRRVRSVEPGEHGGLRVGLDNGAEVEMSRRRSQAFRDALSL